MLNSPDGFFGVDPVILVVESPKAEELAAGITEGPAISAILRMLEIPHMLRQVASEDDLQRALAEFADAAREVDAQRPFAPTIHFSVHGSEEGLAYSGTETLAWHRLRQLLIQFAKRVGRFSPSGLSMVDVSLSACFGAYAKQMFDLGPPHPCFGIVGPDRTIPWADCLAAFVALYHQLFRRGLSYPEAVPVMNTLVGEQIFEAHLPPGVEKLMSPAGPANRRGR